MAGNAPRSPIAYLGPLLAVMAALVIAYITLRGGGDAPPSPAPGAAPNATPAAMAAAKSTTAVAPTPTPRPTPRAVTPTPAPTPSMAPAALVRVVIENADTTVTLVQQLTSSARADATTITLRHIFPPGKPQFFTARPGEPFGLFYFRDVVWPFSYRVTAPKAGETQDLVVRIPEPRRLGGRLLDDRGRPIVGAPFTLRSELPDGTVVAKSREFVTRIDGVFEGTALTAPVIRFVVSDSEATEAFLPFESVVAMIRTPDWEGRSGLQVVLSQGEEAQGIVRSAHDGQPVAGAVVQLRGPRDREGRSGDDGRFTLRGLARGTYDISLTAEGHMPLRVLGLTIPSTLPEFQLEPVTTLQGTLILPEGVPAGTEVTLLAIGREQSVQRLDLTTDGTNRLAFVLANQAPSERHLFAMAGDPGSQVVARVVAAADRSAVRELGELTLRPLEAGQARLLSADEAALDTVEAQLEEIGLDAGVRSALASSGFWPAPTATVGAGGAVQWSGLEADREYLLRVLDSRTKRTLAATLLQPPHKEVPVIPMVGTGRVEGTVLTEMGTACVGVEVSLLGNLSLFEGEEVPVEKRVARTDAAGRFAFEEVPVGGVRLTLGEDAGSARLAAVRLGETTRVNFACRQDNTTLLRIRLEDGARPADRDQFVLMSRAGTETPKTLMDLSGPEPAVPLAPGHYSLVRGATLQVRHFQVRRGIEAPITIDFGTPDATPTPVPTPEPTPDPLVRPSPSPLPGGRAVRSPR